VTFAVLFDQANSARAETALKNEELERTNYRNLIALAQNALDSNNIREMRDLLSRCPEHLRGWEWHHLLARSDDSITTFAGHPAFIDRMTPLPDASKVLISWGRRIAPQSEEFEAGLELWDRSRAERIRSYFMHNMPLNRPAVSRDGRLVAVGAHDQSVWIFDVATGEQLHRLSDLESRVRVVAFSPDREYLYVSSGGVVSKYSMTTGDRVAEVRAHSTFQTDLILSTDGSRLFTACKDEDTIKCWDAESMAWVADIGEHDRPSVLALSPDGTVLCSGSEDGTLARWDVDARSLLSTERFAAPCSDIVFAPDGTLYLHTSDAIYTRGADHAFASLPMRGHELLVSDMSVIDRGRHLLTKDAETIKEWSPHHRGGIEVVGETDAALGVLIQSPDGSLLLCTDESGTVSVWDSSSYELQARWRAHGHRCRAARFSPDGAMLATGGDDRTAAIWSTSDWSLLARFDVRDDWVRNVAWSADQATLIVGEDRSDLQFWDIASGQRTGELDLPQVRTTGFAVSPDYRTIAVGNHVGTVHIVNIEELEVRALTASEQLSSARFSLDGERLFTFGNDGLIRIWDWRAQELVRVFKSHDSRVGDVSQSPDGTRLFSTVAGDEPILWDMQTGEPLLRMNFQGTPVHLPLFSRDGERVFVRWNETMVVALIGEATANTKQLSGPE
jgi:WD40 repeat protein